MIAYKDGASVRLVSRQGVGHTDRFRELAAAVAALKAPTLILDGEVCVFDKDLVTSSICSIAHPMSRVRHPC